MDINREHWITTGWSRDPSGKWIELGHLRSVIYDATVQPELQVGDVADKLNELEDRLTKEKV